MSRVILVTGGSRSGKSVFAEKKAQELGEESVLYVATAIPLDIDMKERIRLHQERRATKGWDTHEGFKDIPEALTETKKNTALLDCVTVFITNYMFDEERDFDTISREDIAVLEKQILDELTRVVETARNENKNLVIVTNEVGMCVVPPYRMGRIFSDMNGKANEMLAGMADEVYLSVCGIPMQLK